MPLVYRVAGVNALVLLATVAVTLVVLAPRKFSSFAADEAVVLAASLVLVALLNLILLRRIVRPLETLTSLARRVDLTRPGARMPGASATSEAGELALTFNEMLARLEIERREATGRVLEAQESERLRIALELHDQVGQELTAVLLGLARVRGLLEPPLRADVEDIQETVRASLEDVRRIALELRPEALDDLGLISALAVLCERFAQRTGIEVTQRFDEEVPELGREEELVVYRVTQEALTNVARHSGADHAELRLQARDGGLTVTVSDRGRGLGADGEPGTGIRGMRERAALISATLDVGPNPDGVGCAVTLQVEGVAAEARA
ncbi:MAG TPA: sensor histidine kinase [Solirubrobacteraceae bacterium]|nr:sensor histidine kinase [Solirubrobacteraceae bacterium]